MKKILFLCLISVSVFAQTGIGTTTPAVKLHVKSNGSIFRMEGSDHAYMELYPQGPSTRYGYLGYLGANSTTLTLMNQFSTGALTFGTNNTNRMWLNSDGKLGIGTATPGTTLHIDNANTFGSDPSNTTSPSLYILNTNNTSTASHATALIRTAGAGGGNPYLAFDILGVRGYSMGIDNADSDKFKFYTNWNLNNSVAPAYTVTTDNKVGIGTDSPFSRLHLKSSEMTTLYLESTSSDNYGIIQLNANTNQNWGNNYHEFMFFQNQGTNIGSIVGSNGGNMVSYNTSSDYRLKTDFKDFNGLDLINKVKTYDYSWKRDSSRMYGVIAHELQEVLPYAVSGKKDAMDADGKIIPQSVDYSKLTPILVKALQEQDVKMKQLEERIVQLEKLLNKEGNN